MKDLGKILSSSSYLVTNLHILGSFGTATAHILPAFIYMQQQVNIYQKEKEKMVYFYFTREAIEKKIYLSPHQQLKAIKLLEKLGILHTQVKGLPPKNYYHLDIDALSFYMEQSVEQNKLAANSERDKEKPIPLIIEPIGSKKVNTYLKSKKVKVKKVNVLTLKNLTFLYNSNINNKNSSKYISPEKISGEIYIENNNIPDSNLNNKSLEKKKQKERRIKRFIKLSKKLAQTISQNKNIKITDSKIKQWANSMRLLQEREGIEFARQKKALIWYDENIGGDFVPVIESGDSFRQKFLKLEAAIERSGKSNKPNKINDTGLGSLSGGKKRSLPEIKNSIERLDFVPDVPWANLTEKVYRRTKAKRRYLHIVKKWTWDEKKYQKIFKSVKLYNNHEELIYETTNKSDRWSIVKNDYIEKYPEKIY